MYITRSSSGYFSYSTNGIDWTDKTNTTLFTGDRWHIAARGTRLIAVSETAGKKKGTASSTAWSAISDSTGLGTGFQGIASTGNQTVALLTNGFGLAEYSPNYTAWSFIAYPYNVTSSLTGQTIFGENDVFLIYNETTHPVLYANAVSTPNDVLYGLNSKINYLISGLHELEDAIESA